MQACLDVWNTSTDVGEAWQAFERALHSSALAFQTVHGGVFRTEATEDHDAWADVAAALVRFFDTHGPFLDALQETSDDVAFVVHLFGARKAWASTAAVTVPVRLLERMDRFHCRLELN